MPILKTLLLRMIQVYLWKSSWHQGMKLKSHLLSLPPVRHQVVNLFSNYCIPQFIRVPFSLATLGIGHFIMVTNYSQVFNTSVKLTKFNRR